MKKGISVLAASVMLLTACTALPVSAEEAAAETMVQEFAVEEPGMEVMPLGTYDAQSRAYLTISGSKATCTTIGNGNDYVYRIAITHYLEKRSFLLFWNEVDSWSSSALQVPYEFSSTYSGLESGTYRVRSEITFSATTGSETIEITSTTVTI